MTAYLNIITLPTCAMKQQIVVPFIVVVLGLTEEI